MRRPPTPTTRPASSHGHRTADEQQRRSPDDVTDYTYDAAGELLTDDDGSRDGHRGHDELLLRPGRRQDRHGAPDGNTTSVAACSSIVALRDLSAYQTGYSYDSLGELVAKTAPATAAAPSGQTTTYSYDAGREPAHQRRTPTASPRPTPTRRSTSWRPSATRTRTPVCHATPTTPTATAPP